MADPPRRDLILIPVVHSHADLGSMGEAFRRAYIERNGRGRYQEHVGRVEAFWANIEGELAALVPDPARVRLYQDGLPVCGRELDIVREVAAAGSVNHRLLLSLVERGATLTGTESPELLLEEYNLVKSLAEKAKIRPGSRSALTMSMEDKRGDVLARRDRFIAGRIAATLEPDRTGLLFIGMLHDVASHLPPDIGVRRPDRAGPA